MKKHNEGYTLVLVLVVILVLAVCATAVLSFSVQNLKTQQRMVERMQAKYAAQGEIEKIVGQLSADRVLPIETDKTDIEILTAWISSCCPNQTIIVTKGENDTWNCEVALGAEKSTENGYKYTVSYNVDISGIIKEEYDNDVHKNVIGYKISDIDIEYTPYEIGGAAS